MADATTYRIETQEILSRLNTLWNNALPVAWPNAAFDPAGAAYIEPIITRQEAFNADVNYGSRTIRHPGLLTINVRVLINAGDGAALGHADTLAGYFRNVTFSRITFHAPTVRPFGPEGEWYRVQVDCPFYRDSIH
jgi:hypothetical protein